MTKFAFGLAGIPDEVFDDVQRENRNYAEKSDFVLNKMPSGASYRQRNVDFFIDYFHAKVKADDKNVLQDMAFAIVYLVKDQASTDFFVDAFFPHMLLVPVRWELDMTRGPAGMRASANQLIPLLTEATTIARQSLRTLRDELIAHASTTPVLLPVKNFKSKVLVKNLRALHADLSGPESSAPEIIVKHTKAFWQKHDLTRLDDHAKDCYIDDADRAFHPPGSDRHGYARATGTHPPACVLSGRRRLGAPYDRLFHYDCQKGEGKQKALLCGCHEPPDWYEAKRNINIAPNDNVNTRGS